MGFQKCEGEGEVLRYKKVKPFRFPYQQHDDNSYGKLGHVDPYNDEHYSHK